MKLIKPKKVIYISPLKSINTTLKERLTELSSNLGIKCKIEKGQVIFLTLQKQLFNVPDILLTTPESLTLMIANANATSLLENTDYFIVDELNEFIASKEVTN